MKVTTLSRVCILLLVLSGCTQLQLPNAVPTRSLEPALVASPTAVPSATPSPEPTPTQTPIPLPSEQYAIAEKARDIGDWEGAVLGYRDLLTRPATAVDLRMQASLRLAQVHMAETDYAEAIVVLENLVTEASDDAVLGAAQFLLADALRISGQELLATQHYSQALAAEPLLASYAHQWIGDIHYRRGDYSTAATAYSQALTESLTTSRRVGLLEKLGLSRAASGDYAGAMAAYDEILSIAQIAQYRARIMFLAAETAEVFGHTGEAYRRMTTLVTTYPTMASAHSALVKLVDAGQPVNELLRGLINYHAGAYAPAVAAFARVMNNDPGHDGTSHYYAALSFLATDSLADALREFEMVIETHPGDVYVPDSWMGKALVLLAQQRLEAAMGAYESGISLYAGRPELPQAVWTVLDRLTTAGAWAETAEYLAQLADAFPNDPRAPEARFRSGMLRYRTGNLSDAQRSWQALTLWYPHDTYAQAAWFWLGKTYLAESQASGDMDAGPVAATGTVTQISETLHLSASQALSRAISLGPMDFYGLRAADLLAGDAPFESQPDPEAACTGDAVQAEAESWLQNWLGLEPETAVGELPASLLDDARLRRGTLLLDLGYFDEGRAELEQLRIATADDALTQYRLALYFRDIGLYRSSIAASTTLWRLSPAQDLRTLPRFIGCLAYPTYYSDLVEAEAATHGLSPLFVYALLRQESLFEGSATSHAAAHGLMQVIPSTGAYIAQSLGWPSEYQTRDLYRPMVSVRFGVWYLVEQTGLAEGNPFVAMAAYNGGPGNSLRWWRAAEGDTDLFAEIITFSETRGYVRRIREHYAAYAYLYGGLD
jgi:soluble lytic murein transglycosylase